MKNNQEASCSRNEVNKNDRGRKETMQVKVGDDDTQDINKMADDFINNFRKQLRLQREESLRRYREMISRGA
ncbi:hypothetical protein DCAR_0102030 [Daucus carota subsp. sativus]|uniref:Uncharacterized protein n=1 Tax=Daucus carota subsp. sativus TaxID=79200 RepID=A0AAF1AJU6_DAUCS|nr:hypothetical protein DCAR_0102030 [Daucus carota subsp. sativus]